MYTYGPALPYKEVNVYIIMIVYSMTVTLPNKVYVLTLLILICSFTGINVLIPLIIRNARAKLAIRIIKDNCFIFLI